MNVVRLHRWWLLVFALLVPLAACAVLAAFRDSIANTNAALVLVILIVAVAASGVRPAGLVAALSSAAWFDFFLTQPYQRFAIDDPADVETALLLVVVGVAVTELALWGQRQQAQASQAQGYLAGVVSAAHTVATGSADVTVLIEHVGSEITDVLDIDGCRFERIAPHGLPRLEADGTVRRGDRVVDVAREGLPVDDEIELLATSAGTVHGRFLLTAAARVSRPGLAQRQVAVTLANEAGAALAGAASAA